MKVVFFSDLHATNKSSKFKSDNNGVSDLLKAQLDFVDFMVDYADKQDASVIAFLGDLTDASVLDPITLDYVTNMLKSIVNGFLSKNPDRRCILIEGNHCIQDAKNRFTVLGAFNKILSDQFHVFTQAGAVTIGDVCFNVVPYMGDFTACAKAVDDAVTDNQAAHNCLLFHFPLIGAHMDMGIVSKGGVNLDGVDLTKFDSIFGGDFHKHQKIKGHPCFYYIGAPFAFTMGENNERGLMDVDFHTDNDMGGATTKLVMNPFRYQMLQCDYLEFSEDNGLSLSGDRVIAKVLDVPVDKLLEVESAGDDFYRLYVVMESKAVVVSDSSFQTRDKRLSPKELIIELLSQQLDKDKLQRCINLISDI
jgi:hypothetical protein